MHKDKRKALQAMRRKEARIQALAFMPGTQKARYAIVENSQWHRRNVGQAAPFRTGTKHT